VSLGAPHRRHLRGVAAVLLAGWAALAVAQDDEQAATRARVDRLGQALQALDARLADSRQARDAATRQLEQVESALTAVHQRLDSLRRTRAQLDDEIHDLEAQRRQLRGRRRAQREALASQLRALYRLGEAPQLKLLLNQDDPARLDRLQTYLNHLSRARTRRLDAIAALDDQLAESGERLAQRRQRLTATQQALEVQRRTLDQRQAERERLVARLDARVEDDQSRRRRLAEARDAAEKRLAEIRERLKRLKQSPPSTAIERTRGDLPWPVSGRVVASFGDGDGVDRNGLLIAAPAGTEVQAVHAGRVVFADWMRGYGNLLIIDHGDDVMTLYAHLQTIAVPVGARVADDQMVARVGNTGGRSQSALYFEVRRGGEPIDPKHWIRRR